MTAPTFHLPACPGCSSVLTTERPFWKFAANTSQARGKKCFIWMGCRHAQPLSPGEKVIDDPHVWAEIEAKWAEIAARLFATKTAGWSPRSIDVFRRSIGDINDLPGATAALDLSPEVPAQQTQPTKE